MPAYVVWFMEQTRFEAAVAEAQLALTLYADNADIVASVVPAAARCYAMMGKPETASRYLDLMVSRYADNATTVRGRFPLNQWLKVSRLSLDLMVRRRNGEYPAAAESSHALAALLAQLQGGQPPDLIAQYGVAGLLIDEARLWEGAGVPAKAAEVYRQALAFLEAHPPAGPPEDIKVRTIADWRTALPEWVARCENPPPDGSPQAVLARIDWLVGESSWLRDTGQSYEPAAQMAEEALKLVDSLDPAQLGADDAARCADLKGFLPDEATRLRQMVGVRTRTIEALRTSGEGG
jgi:hypothetical protein